MYRFSFIVRRTITWGWCFYIWSSHIADNLLLLSKTAQHIKIPVGQYSRLRSSYGLHSLVLKCSYCATAPASCVPPTDHRYLLHDLLVNDINLLMAVQCDLSWQVWLNYTNTRSLGALRAPTSSWRPFGPLDFVLRALWPLRPVRWARLRSTPPRPRPHAYVWLSLICIQAYFPIC